VGPFRRPANQRDLFDGLASTWWDESGILHGLGVLLAPVRVPFVVGVLRDELGPGAQRALDLGSGGGLLAEALDDAGFSIVALDPSLRSLQAGQNHGAISGSNLMFVGGAGEQLPFADATFDAVVCMEVLEHVDDPGAVVAESARVLRHGGIFIYSGPNRTLVNRLGLVFVAQDLLGLVPRGTHQWNRLLRPADMEGHMRSSGINPCETLGVGLRLRSIPRAAWAAIGLLTGRRTYPEAARRIELVSGTGKYMAYQGFGVRR
jgi:2-polyprenyl-6-hydroxyphenyl methylase/3-demethylubiquinone-9 3-methyltransferase